MCSYLPPPPPPPHTHTHTHSLCLSLSQELVDYVELTGARVISVLPEKVNALQDTMALTGANSTMLSDENFTAFRAYGLTFDLQTLPIYDEMHERMPDSFASVRTPPPSPGPPSSSSALSLASLSTKGRSWPVCYSVLYARRLFFAALRCLTSFLFIEI